MPTVERNREEMVRLAAYLRQHPDSLSLDVAEIASRAQTSEEAVRGVLAASDSRRKATKSSAAPRVYQFSPGPLLDKLFAHPLWFVGITFVLAVVAAYLIPPSADVQQQAGQTSIRFNEVAEIGGFLVMFLLHMACYAWRGLSRYAVYGSILVGVSGTTLTVIAASIKNPVPTAPQLPFFLGVAMIMISIFYAIIGIGCSSLGAYMRFRKEDSTLRQRSRQELLQRLFEIEEALKMPAQPVEERRFSWPWLDHVRSRIFVYAAVVGVGISLMMSVSTIAFPGPTGADLHRAERAERELAPREAAKVRSEAFSKVSPAFFVCQFVFASLAVLMQLGLAYLAGRPVRSMLVSLVCGYTSSLVQLIPIGTMGYEWMESQWTTGMISGTVMAILLGLFAGVGAAVEERAYQSRRRKANDPAILLSEFVDIQRSLNSATQSKCVLVVDAAKSSLMKSNADPLVAEWSFRAYQQFIAEIVRDCHGRIYSTAGDGAMAAFDRAADAFQAARTIQTKVADFNAYVSRLKDPFRLRIGIHCGEVSGDLDEVEFTEVLDIAAHVEAASQVGGIAVTASVAEQLPEHRFAEIQELIDTHRVFLALNPTLDPEADLENA